MTTEIRYSFRLTPESIKKPAKEGTYVVVHETRDRLSPTWDQTPLEGDFTYFQKEAILALAIRLRAQKRLANTKK